MIPATRYRRIPKERWGKLTVSCRKAPDLAGTWKQYSDRNFSEFFQLITANFLCFLTGTGRKTLEKNRKISAWNTASRKSPELPGIGRFRGGAFDLGI
jgi:hypothetical protein